MHSLSSAVQHSERGPQTVVGANIARLLRCARTSQTRAHNGQKWAHFDGRLDRTASSWAPSRLPALVSPAVCKYWSGASLALRPGRPPTCWAAPDRRPRRRLFRGRPQVRPRHSKRRGTLRVTFLRDFGRRSSNLWPNAGQKRGASTGAELRSARPLQLTAG